MSGQARALTPGEVRELLEGTTSGEWHLAEEIDDYGGHYLSLNTDKCVEFVRLLGLMDKRDADAQLIAAAPDLARRVLELEAQNAALSAENSRLAAREREFAVLMGVGDGGQYRADWEARAASIAALAAELARAQAGAQALVEWKEDLREIGARLDAVTCHYTERGSNLRIDLDDLVADLAALAQASAEGAGAGEVAG